MMEVGGLHSDFGAILTESRAGVSVALRGPQAPLLLLDDDQDHDGR